MLENSLMRRVKIDRVCAEPKYDFLKTGAMLCTYRCDFESWDAYKKNFDSFETYWHDWNFV